MSSANTKNVIDSLAAAYHANLMLTHDEIRDALIQQIEDRRIKQAQVAKHLSIAPARVAEIRKGERQIQAKEMAPLAELLGLATPNPLKGLELGEPSMIKNLGKVAQGLWREQTAIQEVEEFVPFDKRPNDPNPANLFAVTPEGSSMNLRFPKGTRLICRQVPYGIGSFKPGQYVIVSRTAHDLKELTCKRVEVDAQGVYSLHSESDDPQFSEPLVIGRPDNGSHTDIEVTVEGVVIRAVQDFEVL